MLYYICHWFWGAKLEDGKKSFFLKDEKLQAFARKSILGFLACEGEKEKAKACRNRWLFYFLLNSVNSVNPFSGYSLLVVFLLLFANSPFLVWQSVFIFWGNLIKRSPRMAKYAMLAMTKKGGFPLLLFGFLVEPFRVDDLLLRHSRNFLSGIHMLLNTSGPRL